MDGGKEAGAGVRRMVKVLRKVFERDARRFEEPPVDSPSSPSRTQPREVPLPLPTNSAGGADVSATVANVSTSHQTACHRDAQGAQV